MQLAGVVTIGVAASTALALVAARTGAPMINSPTPMQPVSVGSEASGVTVAVASVSLRIFTFVIDTFPVSTDTKKSMPAKKHPQFPLKVKFDPLMVML